MTLKPPLDITSGSCSIDTLRCALSPLYSACLASYAASQRLSLRGSLPKIRATHRPRNMIIPRLIFFYRTEVKLRFPGIGTRIVPILAAPPTTPASVKSLAVRRHVSLPVTSKGSLG